MNLLADVEISFDESKMESSPRDRSSPPDHQLDPPPSPPPDPLHGYVAKPIADLQAKSSISCLRPRQLVDDTVVNYVMQLLCSVQEHCLFLDSLVLSTSSSTLVVLDDDISVIMAPLHLEDHWTLAVMNVRYGMVEFFDPQSTAAHTAGAKRLMNDFCERRLQPRREWAFHECLTPQQNNTWDCAVHVLAISFFLVASMRLPPTIDGSTWRRLLSHMIMGEEWTDEEGVVEMWDNFDMKVGDGVRLLGMSCAIPHCIVYKLILSQLLAKPEHLVVFRQL